MTLSELHHMTTLLLAVKIHAEQLTVKGKESGTLSFTAPRHQFQDIDNLCCKYGWTFHTSRDEFIARHNDRYQIHIRSYQS